MTKKKAKVPPIVMEVALNEARLAGIEEAKRDHKCPDHLHEGSCGVCMSMRNTSYVQGKADGIMEAKSAILSWGNVIFILVMALIGMGVSYCAGINNFLKTETPPPITDAVAQNYGETINALRHQLSLIYDDRQWWKSKCQRAWSVLSNDRRDGKMAFQILDEPRETDIGNGISCVENGDDVSCFDRIK
jgi:hypothetical protein